MGQSRQNGSKNSYKVLSCANNSPMTLGQAPRSLSENGSTAEENLDLAIFRAFIS
jgi:hypothetical protein